MKTTAGLCSWELMRKRMHVHTFTQPWRTHRGGGGGSRDVRGGDRPGFHSGRTGLGVQGHRGEGRGQSRKAPAIKEHSGGDKAAASLHLKGTLHCIFTQSHHLQPNRLMGMRCWGRETGGRSEGNKDGPVNDRTTAGPR